ncbi:MAG: sialate O-acetylesterase, partial [Muribaculaceae bacterium]
MKLRHLFFFTLLALTLPAAAAIRLANIFGDGMVLQQNSTVVLRGDANPGALISVNPGWGGKALATKADADGKWALNVQTPAFGGPYSIIFKENGKQSITLSDVLIGEVWLCSGQSNMEMPVRGFRGQPVNGSADIIAAAKASRNLRLYRQPNAWKTTVADDIFDAHWTVANAKNVADFSAVGYVFADMLQSSLDVPVGIIQCAWSMSTIQAWMPRTTFEEMFPDIQMPDVNGTEFGWTQGTPTLLWNAMVAPWRGFPIAGVIWYQGEANTPNAELYRSLFPAMVNDWRKLFVNDSLPFYYCQLAPWRDEACHKTLWADFRKAQTELLDVVPNTEMVTVGDLGDSIFIHFPQKIEVGKRFAFLALENNYGYDGLDSRAPIAESVIEDGSDYIVTFKHGANGLTPENASLSGFEI